MIVDDYDGQMIFGEPWDLKLPDIYLLLLLLRWPYSPMWTFASSTNLFQTSRSLDLSFQLLILYFNIFILKPFPLHRSIPDRLIVPRPSIWIPNLKSFYGMRLSISRPTWRTSGLLLSLGLRHGPVWQG